MKQRHHRQAGQTLIETIVAALILVMGIAAAAGLAAYAFGSSSSVVNQIVATGLAREGLEAVKNMRDTNWLKLSMDSGQCYDFLTNTDTGGNCYKQWLNPTGCSGLGNDKGYCLISNGSNSAAYVLDIDTDPTHKIWKLAAQNSSFGLDLMADASSGSWFYVPHAGSPAGNSRFYRKITVTKDATPPFDKTSIGPRLTVVSQVWWTDKRCPPSDDWPGTGKCSLQLQSNLTNWKDYQP